MACAVALGVGLVACQQPRPMLEVSLASAPTARPFVVHGNCLAGYSLGIPLVLRERGGVAVTVSMLSLRVQDGSGALLANETLDAASLEARFGATTRVEAGGTARVDLSVPVAHAPDAVTMAIEVRGVAGGSRVTARLPDASHPVTTEASPLGAGGACGP